MAYDWDGRQTRRIRLLRLTAAIVFGLVEPVAGPISPELCKASQ